MRRTLIALGAPVGVAALLAGCAEGDPLGTPAMSPVGAGLAIDRTAIPTTVPVSHYGAPTSLYGRRSRDLLTDIRASNVGDTLTVVIALDESAEFENESERERAAQTDFDAFIAGSGRGFDGPEGSAEAEGALGVGSRSRYRGTGAIDRSERLRLNVAAVVTEVLANGYLVIAGQQEIRVNDEVRVLKLAGIVNPLDLSRFNTVEYDRVAEARISYGGRGRQSEVQSPNWGQQIFDRVVPF